MKPLNKFTNIDKAKLLHELFPDQIPLILDNILAVCEDLQSNREAYAAQWKPGFFTFENWLMLYAGTRWSILANSPTNYNNRNY